MLRLAYVLKTHQRSHWFLLVLSANGDLGPAKSQVRTAPVDLSNPSATVTYSNSSTAPPLAFNDTVTTLNVSVAKRQQQQQRRRTKLYSAIEKSLFIELCWTSKMFHITLPTSMFLLFLADNYFQRRVSETTSLCGYARWVRPLHVRIVLLCFCPEAGWCELL